MEVFDAIDILDKEVINAHRFDTSPSAIKRYGDMVALGVTYPEKEFADIAWQAGILLLKESDDMKRLQRFDLFGWRVIAAQLGTALREGRVIDGLSFVDRGFLPPFSAEAIYLHSEVSRAITEALAANPRALVVPNELVLASLDVQKHFAILLAVLDHRSAPTDVRLQWAASALRLLPVQLTEHAGIAVSLVATLLDDSRPAMAYYVFRALAEQHENLWEHPIASRVLRIFIQHCQENQSLGWDSLVQLAVDEFALLGCAQQLDLLLLVGALGIYLVRSGNCPEAETAAWALITELHGSYTLVAEALGAYLRTNQISELPQSPSDLLNDAQASYAQELALVELELRPRSYAGLSLANRIYQHNVHHLFQPILNDIRGSKFSENVFNQIDAIDPTAIITSHDLQRASTSPIAGRMLRSMCNDNRDILAALRSAAYKRVELEQIRRELRDVRHDTITVFDEFALLMQDLDSDIAETVATLLPMFWSQMQQGVANLRERDLYD